MRPTALPAGLEKEVEMSAIRWFRPVPFLVLALLTLPAACEEGNEFPTSPGKPEADAIAAMTQAIQDEFLAENTYLRVLADFGKVLPFHTIVYAEQRHSEAIAYLFLKRGFDVPGSSWDINNVPTYDTLKEACAAGVEAEEENIALYDELLKKNLPEDVEQVFKNNRAASFNRHLPEFESCD
jgi:hypothetical protein